MTVKLTRFLYCPFFKCFRNSGIDFLYTVYIRKPDDSAFEWPSLGHFRNPVFKWFFQDGGQIWRPFC